jgi:chemosensory pili system protein ChpA (sensor histidine kinase/response regulator)
VQVDIPLELDLGPLAWVKDEVVQTLGRARTEVEAIIAGTAAPEAGKRAHDEIHQTSGAFELIGIEGLATYTREIERHLKAFNESPQTQSASEVLGAVERALRRLTSHLEEVFSGAPCKPTVLTREYAALHRLRGSEAGASDLFFPDLNRKPAKLEGAEPIPGDRLPSYLLGARRGYEKGLLTWLRGDKAGLTTMREHVTAVERAFPLPAQRSFWWSVSGLFDAIRVGGVGETVGVKQLAARIDLQLRRFMEGSTKVSDRLRREVLFHIGRAENAEGRAREVQSLYGLKQLLPAPGALRNGIDYVALRPNINALAEKINEIRAGWQRTVSGQSDSRDGLRADCAAASKLADALQRPSLANLLSTLAEVVPSATIESIPDKLAVEFSSALLFADTALANFAGDAAAYETEAASLAEELHVAAHGLGDDAHKRAIPQITRRAQERESVRTLLFEVRENLTAVESALDAWVRGNAPLQIAPLSAKLAQTVGVFAISDQLVAGEHVRALDADLAALSAEIPASEQTELVSRLAEKLSVLGFYVDAKEKQPDVDVTHLLKPVQPNVEEQDVATQSRDTNRVARSDAIVSVESDVERQRKELASLVARIQGEPHDAQLRTEISSRLNQLLQDAKLLGNGELVGQIRQAMVALEKAEAETVSSDVIALTQTLAQTDAMPVPETSTQTQALLAKDEVEQDEALTEIYLEEATEIMESLRGYVQALSVHPGDHETLISTRRSFHTLKGSGRMVGFIELGDCAWEVERHLNERISHETPLTLADRALLTCAQSEFDKWIAAIKLDVRASRGLDRTVLDAALRAANANPEPPKPTKPIAAAPVAPSPAVSSPVPSMPNDPGLSLMQFDSFMNLAPTPSPQSNAFTNVDTGVLLGSGAAAAAAAAAFTGTAFAMTAAPQMDGLLPEDFFLEAAIEDALNHNVNDAVIPAPAASIEQALSPVAPTPQMLDEPEILEAPVFAPYVAQTHAPAPHAGIAAVRELPPALHAIMTEEAAGHLAVLAAEVERMQTDEAMGPSDAMIRAAHTLKGMHRSVGMDDIGSLAGDLEAALIALKNEPPSEDYLPAVATAVAALQIQCQCLRDRVTPDEADAELVNIARDSLASININKPARSADDYIYANEAVLADLKAIDAEPSDFQFAAPPAVVEALPPHRESANEAAQDQLIAHELEHAIQIAEVYEMPAAVLEPMVMESGSADFAAQLATATMIAGGGMATAFIATPSVAAPVVKPAAPSAFIEPTPLLVVAQPPAVSPPVVSTRITAAPAVVAPAGFSAAMRNVDVLAGIRDDLELTVLPIFLEEAQELFPAASAQVRQWREDPKDVSAKQSLMRTMHTIKGSARMAGAMRVGELAHQLESRLEEDERKLVVSPALFEALEFDLDRIAFLLDRLERGEADTPLPGTQSAEPAVALVETAELEEPVAPAAVIETEIPAAQNAPNLSKLSENSEQFDVTEIYANAANTPLGATALAAAKQPVAPFVIQKAVAESANDVMAWLQGDQAAQQQVLRVRSDAVERLADETGEMSISRSRAESELKSLRGNLNELTSSVVRLRTQVREIEIQAETQIQSRLTQVQDESTTFDPLEFDRFTRFQELTRSLAEGVNDVQTVQQSFVSSLDAADSALSSQSRIARSLQSQLQSIRTVPFVSLRERLYRTLRQSARDLNKRANMDIRGGDLSIDRSVLERLAPLVEHVLRNSLAHGIEMPSDRLAKGKSETGEILIDLRQQGNLVELTLTDDGRGFDVEAIRNKAIAQGLAKEGDQLSDAQWIEHIFLPGFTTASEITSISGRGVGMDVVRTEIGALGGRVEIRAENTTGAKFVLFVPLTLTLLNVVMVQIGVHRYGIPAAMVEAVKTVKRADFVAAQAAGEIQHGRERIAMVSMHHWLGETPQLRDDKGDQILIIRSGSRAVALDADAVQGNQEVVLKRMGPQLSRVQGLVGVTLLGDGDIVLLYDPIQLVSITAEAAARMASEATASEAATIAHSEISSVQTLATGEDPLARAPSETVAAAKPVLRVVPSGAGNVVQFRQPAQVEKPLVLVVDDSLTVRKITTRFLEREGFRVLSAKDGMDALAVLSEHKPSVILLDIEMPRMDGFEFTRAAKGDAELKKIPIIMITSRTAEKHRNHAMELGVNVYLGKPYQDEELLKNINMFVVK